MKNFLKNYGFILCMLTGIVGGCIVGLFWPEFADSLEPLGTVFINLMFCVVVPMVFCSIASAIANMPSMKRAGKVMGATLITFFVTAAIAAIIMYTCVRIFPIVTAARIQAFRTETVPAAMGRFRFVGCFWSFSLSRISLTMYTTEDTMQNAAKPANPASSFRMLKN